MTITIFSQHIYMPNDKIGAWEYYPSILALLKEKELIEEDVDKLQTITRGLAIKNGSSGGLGGGQGKEYEELLLQIRSRLSSAMQQTAAIGEAEDKQYATAKSLMKALKNLEANIAVFKEQQEAVGASRRGATAEALDNSALSANSAYLEVVLMLTGLIFLIILCASAGLTKDATTIELVFVVGVLVGIAYLLYDYFLTPAG